MATQRPRTIFLLRLLQLNIYNMLVEELREFGLSPIQYMVLSILSSRGSWSTAELARRFHIAPQSMNEVVASLRKKKLIARRESPGHRRILNIHLTAAGKRLLDKCDMDVDRIEDTVFASYSARELSAFRELMSRALVQFTPGERGEERSPPVRRRPNGGDQRDAV